MSHEIRQLSIFIENKQGELTEITEILSKNEISIKSIMLIDSTEFGILRVIVDKVDLAKEALTKEGFSSKINSVFGVKIHNHIGSFNEVVKTLSNEKVDIKYTYTVNDQDFGIFIFKVDDCERAIKVLQNQNIEIIKSSLFQ